MSLLAAVIANAHEDTKAILMAIGGAKGHRAKEHKQADFLPAFQRIGAAPAKQKTAKSKDEQARWNARLFVKLQAERARRAKANEAKREAKKVERAARKAKRP